MGTKPGSKSNKNGKQNKSCTGKLSSNEQNSEDQNEPQADLSLLRKPIDISATGIKHVAKVFANGTAEMQSLLEHECEIIYECRVCRSLFRSLANFISHKRIYCREQFNDIQHSLNKKYKTENYTTFINPEPPPASNENEDWRTSDETPITSDDPENVVKNVVPRIINKAKPKKDLSYIVEKLSQRTAVQTVTESFGHISATKLYDDVHSSLVQATHERKDNIIHIDPLETNRFGVFQTVINSASVLNSENVDLMKTQVFEVQQLLSDDEAVLDSTGKMIENTSSQLTNKSVNTALEKVEIPEKSTLYKKIMKNDHVCIQCNSRFSTRKTLNHHIKSLHMKYRMCFPCPYCKVGFANKWSVFRHLYKVHRKTSAQVKKLRAQIQKKAYRKEVNAETDGKIRKRSSQTDAPQTQAEVLRQEQQRIDEENQAWMDNFEDDLDLQRCGGCGRRFERKAALNSHFQICQKRIAARNNSGKTARTSNQASASSPDKATSTNLDETQNKIDESANPVSSLSRIRHTSGNWTDPIKKDIPEKKIEIQIRRDYCKMGSSSSTTTQQPSSRPTTPFISEELYGDISVKTEIEYDESDGIYKNDIEELASSNNFCTDAISDEETTSSALSSSRKYVAKRTYPRSGIVEQNKKSDKYSPVMSKKKEIFSPLMENKMKEFINLPRLQCLPCRKRFHKLTNLRRHVAVHMGWTRYSCTVCSYKCFDKYDCVAHIAKVHVNGNRNKAQNLVAIIGQSDHNTDSTHSTTDEKCEKSMNGDVKNVPSFDQISTESEDNVNKSEEGTRDLCDKNSEEAVSNADTQNIEPANSPVNEEAKSALRKMVMEVIFGSGDNALEHAPTVFSAVINGDIYNRSSSGHDEVNENEEGYRTPPVVGESSDSSESCSRQMSPDITLGFEDPSENEKKIRPVRNRVKKEREDFIYDLSDACLNPKRDENKVSPKSTNRKQESAGVPNFSLMKYIPKLTLVRTESDNMKGMGKGSWRSSYTECETAVITDSKSIRKSSRTFDSKTASDNLLKN